MLNSGLNAGFCQGASWRAKAPDWKEQGFGRRRSHGSWSVRHADLLCLQGLTSLSEQYHAQQKVRYHAAQDHYQSSLGYVLGIMMHLNSDTYIDA